MKMNNNLIMTVIAIALVGALSFYGGIQYQKTKVQSGNFARFQDGNGIANKQIPSQINNQLGQMNGRPVSGEITEKDDNTLTIKTDSGDTKIVVFSDSTSFAESTKVDSNVVEVGDQVMIIGNENSDGILTALSITLGERLFKMMP